MKRAALYVRVSTQEQKNSGLSVDSQIDALEKYCEEHGYMVAGVYNDAGISARKKYTKRPALLQLLEDCKQCKIDIILFTRLDRWFRAVAGYYEVQSVLDACKVPWRAIWEDYETETSQGIFKVNIMLSVAQAEVDRDSEIIRLWILRVLWILLWILWITEHLFSSFPPVIYWCHCSTVPRVVVITVNYCYNVP